jgi:hypothetical protein
MVCWLWGHALTLLVVDRSGPAVLTGPQARRARLEGRGARLTV